MSFQEWLYGVYGKGWEDIKNEFKADGYSIEVILEERKALYENYKWEVMNLD